MSSPRRWIGGIALAILAGLAIWYGQTERGVPLPSTVTVYGFSATENALRDGVLPAFRAHRTAAQADPVEFVATFAGSGAITQDIVGRLPVEIAILSSEVDAARLSSRGLAVGRPWRHLPRGGVVTRSPMVILVRAGNPKRIETFPDLLREDVAPVFCDPRTSGAGEWALLSVYAALRAETGDADAARRRLDGLRGRIAVTAPSARAGLRSFLDGAGDALVTYESEWRNLSAEARSTIEMVEAPGALLSEHVVVPIDRNVLPENREAVDDFLEYLWSDEAQALLARHGFRVADEAGAADEAAAAGWTTLADLGGADEAYRRILEPWLRRARSTGSGRSRRSRTAG